MMRELIAHCVEQLDTQLDTMEKSVARLSDRDVWTRMRPELNSIGNLILHLAGSEYQHLVSGIGGKPFIRERSNEFLADGGRTGEQLIESLKAVRLESKSVLAELDPNDLAKMIDIRYPAGANAHVGDYAQSGLSILLFVVEHSAYHVGQIVYMTKWLQSSADHILQWKH